MDSSSPGSDPERRTNLVASHLPLIKQRPRSIFGSGPPVLSSLSGRATSALPIHDGSSALYCDLCIQHCAVDRLHIRCKRAPIGDELALLLMDRTSVAHLSPGRVASAVEKATVRPDRGRLPDDALLVSHAHRYSLYEAFTDASPFSTTITVGLVLSVFGRTTEPGHCGYWHVIIPLISDICAWSCDFGAFIARQPFQGQPDLWSCRSDCDAMLRHLGSV